MATVCQHEGEIAFCSGNIITIFSQGKCHSQTYVCPLIAKEYHQGVDKKTHEENGEDGKKEDLKHEDGKDGKAVVKDSDCILCCRFSPCGQYFAVCDDHKQLIIWKTGDQWTIHSTRLLARRCTSLVFTNISSAVLVADKSGDVYRYSIADPDQDGQLILGHVSMLLDITLAGDDKFVVTSDRDEKVRVTCYPNTHSIQSFCLGHTEFVSRLLYIEKCDRVLSGSGDGTIRTWDYKNGLQTSYRNCHKDLTLNDEEYADISQFSYSKKHNLLVVAFDRRPSLLVYSMTDSGSLDYIQRLECEAEVWSLCLDNSHRLWVLLKQESNVLQVFYMPEGDTYQFLPASDEDPDVLNIRNKLNLDCTFFKASMDIECIFSTLHKARIDNMKKYLEQKQERLSGKKVKEQKSVKHVLPSGEVMKSEEPHEKKIKIS